MLLVILNLLALYIINYPTQFFKVSRFNIYGLNKLRFNAAKLFIKIVKPFITNDFTNKLLILVFINSSCLAFYLVNLPDSSYTGLYKNLIYSFLSASIFSIFVSSLPNERRKYNQAHRMKIEFVPLIERDNMIRAELDFWDNLISKQKFNVDNHMKLQDLIIDVQHNNTTLTKAYHLTALHHHGLSVYNENASLYDVMLEIIKDDITFILRIKECDTSLFPEINESLQEFESQIVWLQNTVSGAVRTSPEYRNKAIAQSISACMARKQILLKAYSDGARNYCNDPFDCIADKLSYNSNIQVLMMIYRLILENVKNTKETLNKITTVIKNYF